MILTSHFSEVDFVPDGLLASKAWAESSRIRFNRDAFSGRAYPQSKTAVSSLWTNEHLYLAFWCSYESLTVFAPGEECAAGSELWTRDVVEAFIAPDESDSSHYYEVEVSPDNRALELEIQFQGRLPHRKIWQSNLEHATRIDLVSKVWTAEIRIPVQSMGVRRLPGGDWRINVFRADGAGSGDERRLLNWAPLDASNRSFHQPESFGILRFGNPGS